jgi:DNA topoisomerase-1
MSNQTFKPATEADRKRLKVPPAWTDVVVAVGAGKVRAKGRDGKGRAQAIYSASHTTNALNAKFKRLQRFNAKLPAIMRRTMKDLGGEQGEEASVLRLIYLSGFRNGGDDGNGKVKAYGASNLRAEHIAVEGDTVRFDFIGKLGVRQQHEIRDAGLAADLAARKATADSRDGALFATTAPRVLAYLKRSGDFKVHDLRTWNATELALAAVASTPAPQTALAFWIARDTVGDLVAAKLGDTRKIVLESYIDSAVFAGWRTQLNINENETRPKIKKSKAALHAGTTGTNGSVLQALQNFTAKQAALIAA